MKISWRNDKKLNWEENESKNQCIFGTKEVKKNKLLVTLIFLETAKI